MTRDFVKMMLFFDFLGLIIIAEILLVEKLKFYLSGIRVSLNSNAVTVFVCLLIVLALLGTIIISWNVAKKNIAILNAKKEMILITILSGLWLSGIFFILER